jgi:hypothetical protein
VSESNIIYQSTDTVNIKQEAANIDLAKQMSDVLQQHYPNHLWAVNVDWSQGVASVKNLLLSGDWGFLLHLTAIYSISEFFKRLVMAAGELLERYDISRGACKLDEVLSVPVDEIGNRVFTL